MDDKKSLLANGTQVAPAGMADVSEEDDLQAVEEVSTLCSECTVLGRLLYYKYT